jgi:hypothetical protein
MMCIGMPSRQTMLGFLVICFVLITGPAIGGEGNLFPNERDVLGMKRSFLHDRIDGEGRPLGDVNRSCIGGGTGLCDRITFSETVSYVLFALVLPVPGETKTDIERDREDFLRVWRWAKKNLQRRNLKQVFSWDCRDERYPDQRNEFFKKWTDVAELDKSSWTTGAVDDFTANLDWFAHEDRKRDHLMAWRWVPKLAGTERGGVPYMRQKVDLRRSLSSLHGSDSCAAIPRATEDDGEMETLTWQDGHQVATDGDVLTAFALYLAANRSANREDWGNAELSEMLRDDAADIVGDLRRKAIFPFVPGEIFNAERERFFNIVYGITDDLEGRLSVARRADSVRFWGNKFYIAWWHEPWLDMSSVAEIEIELDGRGKFQVALEDTLDGCARKEPDPGSCQKQPCCSLDSKDNCRESCPMPANTKCTAQALKRAKDRRAKETRPLAEALGRSGCEPGYQVETAWTIIGAENQGPIYRFQLSDFRKGRYYGETGGEMQWDKVKNVKLLVESRGGAEIELKRISLITKPSGSDTPFYLLSNAHGDLRINVSYFMPFAYRTFAVLDPKGKDLWTELLKDTYEILEDSMTVTLCKKEVVSQDARNACEKTVTGNGLLFPNWFNLDLVTGSMVDTVYHDRDDYLFGWDAFRTLWFLGFSDLLLKDKPYRKLLERSKVFFQQELEPTEDKKSGTDRKESKIFAVYEIDGKNPRDGDAVYPVYLSLFDQLGDKGSANRIRRILEKQERIHRKGNRVWLDDDPSDYYKGFWNFLGAYTDFLIRCGEQCAKARQLLEGAAASDRLDGGSGNDKLDDVAATETIRPKEDWTKSVRPELFIDFSHREEEARDNKKTDFTDQSLVRFDARLGFTPRLTENPADITPFVTISGVQSREDSFSFENNVQPGVGVWVRPIRPFAGDHWFDDLVADIRVIGTYSWNTYYNRDQRNEFDQDGNVVKAALDWYGETELWPSVNYVPRVSFYLDSFSQYTHAQKGPSDIFRWSSRSGLAVDAGLSRVRLYPRFNGVYGFSAKEPFFNNYELGAGIAWQPLYNIRGKKLGWFGSEFLRSMRLYGEYVDVSYMDRHNRRFFESQVDSYWRVGLEFWGGR